MKARLAWVKLPSQWITTGSGLANFSSSKIAENAAALMCLAVLCHEADQQTGIARVTFDGFEKVTGKSRTTIAAALNVLRKQKLIEETKKQSFHQIKNFDPKAGWAKLPNKYLYQKSDYIQFFDDCNLRKRAELDAIKLYFLFAAFRDNASNFAMISYDKIEKLAGIPREHIKRANSLLAMNGLVHSESRANKYSQGIAQAYRLSGIDPYIHAGTQGRREMPFE
jgi:hypothetical protein